VWQGRCWQLTVHGGARQHVQVQQLDARGYDAIPMFLGHLRQREW
jgi:hypothetical protein